MGLFDNLFGKKTGVIEDTSHISIEWVTTSLRILSESFPNDSVIYHANNESALNNFFYSPSLFGGRIKIFTEDNISHSSFIKGINVFNSPVLKKIVVENKFRQLIKPFLFSNDSSIAKEITGWPLHHLSVPAKDGVPVHEFEGYLLGETLNFVERGLPVPSNLKGFESIANAIVSINRIRNSIGGPFLIYDFVQLGWNMLLIKDYTTFVQS